MAERLAAEETSLTDGAERHPLQIETNGINVIGDAERKGRPRSLFWPWFAANVSVLGLSYGSFVLGFGISFWQGILVGLIGIIVSFLLCGFIAVAGKRGSAPTMVLGRAAFGGRGNKLPSLISWVLTVGWETVLTILATLATATVFTRLGVGGGTGTEVIALIVVAALTVIGGGMGFDLIMRMQSGLTVGTSVAPVVLLVFGVLLAGSSTSLSSAIGANPIGALTTLLPTWFLVPFAIVAVLGLIGGSVLDIYSSGLALLTAGLPAPRFVAALIDGTVMIGGTIYVVFFASNFVGQFEGFLTTLGVPIAAWAGIMLADIALRRRDYAEADLYNPAGRYGNVRPLPIAVIVVATALGWGLVTNTAASWLKWQGYLLGPFGLGGKGGAWAFANLGVLLALVLGFAVTLAFGRSAVRAEESAPAPQPA